MLLTRRLVQLIQYRYPTLITQPAWRNRVKWYRRRYKDIYTITLRNIYQKPYIVQLSNILTIFKSFSSINLEHTNIFCKNHLTCNTTLNFFSKATLRGKKMQMRHLKRILALQAFSLKVRENSHKNVSPHVLKSTGLFSKYEKRKYCLHN